MKQRLLFYVCTLFASLILTSCGAEDTQLKKKIEMELSESHPSISVNVLNGIVTLTGTVDNDEQKVAVGNIVKNTKYVKSVTNKIYIKPEEPIIQETPDQIMTKSIVAALSGAGYSRVMASVSDSVITLTGESKRSDLKKIMQIANDLHPKKVVNELKIK